MKSVYVQNLKAGDAVDEIFVLAEKSMGRKKDGNPFLNVVLADKTGRIKGVVWDGVEKIAAGVSSGDVVRAKGAVGEYRGELQLVVKEMEFCAPDTVDKADFLPTGRRNVDEMFKRLKGLTKAVQTEYWQALFNAFFNDDAFVKKFKAAPAAKKMHHAYAGGLLEHTLSMVILTDRIAGHYGGIDRDLLLMGAVLHDIGKVDELTYDFKIDYSDQGQLLNHIVIGLEMVTDRIKTIPDFPEEKALLLKHLLVSHHGSRKFGSPEPPKTIEAILLNYIDEIDSKINGIRDFMAGEDPKETWTSYHRILGRHFYKGTDEKA